MSAKNVAVVLPLLLLAGVCAAIWAPLAAANPATVGALGKPDVDCAVGPFDDALVIQPDYMVPFDGMIIEWKFESGAEGPNPESKLTVLRQEGSKYKNIGETTLGSVDSEVIVGVPADIAVQVGDMLGLYTPSSPSGDCLVSEAGALTVPIISGGVLVGEEEEVTTTETDKRLPIQAIVLPPPVITKLEPSTVVFDREDEVRVIGENFERVESVTLGGSPVAFTEVSDTELKFVTPREPVGELPVQVKTPAGTTAVTKASTLGFGPPLGSSDGTPPDNLLPVKQVTAKGGPAKHEPAPTTCKVPKLKGRSLKGAKQAIRKAGCKVGKVTPAKGVGAAKAKVGGQQPAPAKQVPDGTKVAIKLG